MIWLWVSGKCGDGLDVTGGPRINPSLADRVWDYIFERDATGNYVRCARVLSAIRNRRRAYLLAGVTPVNCAPLALRDLGLVIRSLDSARVESSHV